MHICISYYNHTNNNTYARNAAHDICRFRISSPRACIGPPLDTRLRDLYNLLFFICYSSLFSCFFILGFDVCHVFLYLLFCSRIRRICRARSRGHLNFKWLASIGWHYLSNTTCLIWPHLFYGSFAVSTIINNCYYSPLLNNTCARQVVLDKWFPLNTEEAWEDTTYASLIKPRGSKRSVRLRFGTGVMGT